eukprot:2989313-Rhodomonas_salina.1
MVASTGCGSLTLPFPGRPCPDPTYKTSRATHQLRKEQPCPMCMMLLAFRERKAFACARAGQEGKEGDGSARRPPGTRGWRATI